ncbi:MAG: hypothetical protein O3A65_08565 [Proteobacteria bacterium]|nr:hypothetical protein [Pseudomonadota bacterium]
MTLFENCHRRHRLRWPVERRVAGVAKRSGLRGHGTWKIGDAESPEIADRGCRHRGFAQAQAKRGERLPAHYEVLFGQLPCF